MSVSTIGIKLQLHVMLFFLLFCFVTYFHSEVAAFQRYFPRILKDQRYFSAQENSLHQSSHHLLRVRARRLHSVESGGGAENGVNLSSLTNFQSDGEYLKASIKKWLDVEYIEQEVHARLGEEVCRIYLDRRSDGVDDLGQLLMDIGTSLESFDMGDAFVNGWDIANRASDFLMLRMERELCSCAGDLSEFEVTDSSEVKDEIPRPDIADDDGLLPADAVTPIELTMTSTRSSSKETKKSFKKAKYGSTSRGEWVYGNAEGRSNAEMIAAMRGGQLRLPNNSEEFMQIMHQADSHGQFGDLFGRVHVSAFELRKATRQYNNEFSRFKLLAQFFEGDVCWKEMHPVLALALGFRVAIPKEKTSSETVVKSAVNATVASSGAVAEAAQCTTSAAVPRSPSVPVVIQQQAVAMTGWEGLSSVPDFSDAMNEALKHRMILDLPANAGSTDVVVESLVGMELYKMMKESNDPVIQHRILIIKWLYVHGFLNNVFPAEEKFVPFHFLEASSSTQNEDDEYDDTW